MTPKLQRILIVHEKPSLLESLRSQFSFGECEIHSASNWTQCAALCADKDFDLVLLSSSITDFPPELLAFHINNHVREGKKPLRFVLCGEPLTLCAQKGVSPFGIVSQLPMRAFENGLDKALDECLLTDIPQLDPQCTLFRTISRSCVAINQSLRMKGKFSGDIQNLRHEQKELLYSLEFLRHKVDECSAATVSTIVMAAEARDPYMRSHIKLVARLSFEIAKRIGLSGSKLENITKAARLHDIGKIGIPDEILNKRGALTFEQHKVIRAHPVIGKKILEKNPAFHTYIDVVLYHHERLDGTGYPEGRRGSDIPFEALIVAVADIVSALTTDRPYRASVKPADALDIIHPQKGIKLMADAVDAVADFIQNSDGRDKPSVFRSHDVTLPHFLRL
ncbi:MAG: HD-GYP domain-containing protein [Planctomycetota bacterium]|nr:HD-GYP domain-containing protein [Planctomycetota bacterium]